MFPELADIRSIREKIGWSQLELAKKVDVSQSAITKYESGTQVPSYAVACRIFEVLYDTDIQLDPNIEELMTTKVISVTPITSLGKSIELMKKNSLSQIPVIKDNQVYGTVSEGLALDLLDKFHHIADFKDVSVGKVMTQPLPILPKNTKLREASQLLRRYHAILVSDFDKIVGIISRADLLDY